MARGHVQPFRGQPNTWRLYASAGSGADGKRRRPTKLFRGTITAANRELTRWQAELDRGDTVVLTDRATTVGSVLEAWYLANMTPARCSASTTPIVRTYIDAYLKRRPAAPGADPAAPRALWPIWTVPVRKLDAATLERHYGQLERAGAARHGGPLAASTVDKVHRIVHAAFAYAVRHDLVPVNPADKVQREDTARFKAVVPTANAAGVLLDFLEHDHPELAMFVRLAAITGARRGEMIALRWTDLDIDDDHHAVQFARVVVRSKDTANREILVEQPRTKTGKPRTVALDAGTAAELVAFRRRAKERALACGVRLKPDGFVFTDEPDGARPYSPTWATQAYRRARVRAQKAKVAGLDRVRLYDLTRHLMATLAIDAGLPITAVSGRLGHARTSTTLDIYAAAVPARDHEIADTVANLLDARRRHHPNRATRTV